MLHLFLFFAVTSSCEDGLKPALSALQRNNRELTASQKIPSARIGSARVYIGQGTDEKARDFLQKALSDDPNDPSAMGEPGVLEVEHEPVSFPPLAQPSPAFHKQRTQVCAGFHRLSDTEAEDAAIQKLRAPNAPSIHLENPKAYVY